jgi:hypothetical protein
MKAGAALSKPVRAIGLVSSHFGNSIDTDIIIVPASEFSLIMSIALALSISSQVGAPEAI